MPHFSIMNRCKKFFQKTKTETIPMIPKENVERLYQTLIVNFGGSPGIRDVQAFESAIRRPYQAFFNPRNDWTSNHRSDFPEAYC